MQAFENSSGSAALVVAGECDMAIEATREGRSEFPSSFCGAVGHKPTHGLVPYTGVFPIELTLDHTRPIARTAGDAARLLEVLAGADGLDPRQPAGLRTEAYTKQLTGAVASVSTGSDRAGRRSLLAVITAIRSLNAVGGQSGSVRRAPSLARGGSAAPRHGPWR
jgi:amidase